MKNESTAMNNRPRCPNIRCGKLRHFHHVLCSDCWRLVTPSLRYRIATMPATLPAGAARLAAIRQAIDEATEATRPLPSPQQELF